MLQRERERAREREYSDQESGQKHEEVSFLIYFPEPPHLPDIDNWDPSQPSSARLEICAFGVMVVVRLMEALMTIAPRTAYGV